MGPFGFEPKYNNNQYTEMGDNLFKVKKFRNILKCYKNIN